MPRAAPAIAPIKCSATSKRSGRRCGRWATPGQVVCPAHGSKSPQARRLGEVRKTLAELLRHGEVRPIADVLIDAMGVADAAMRDIRTEVVEAGERDGRVSVDLVDRMLSIAGRASTLATTLHAAGIAERIADQATRNDVHDLVIKVVDAVRSAWLGSLVLPDGPRDEFAAWFDVVASRALMDAPVPMLPAHLRWWLNPPGRLAIGLPPPVEPLDLSQVLTSEPAPASGSSDRTAPLRPASAVAPDESHGRSSEPLSASEQRLYLREIGLGDHTRSIIPGGDRR